MQAAQLLLESDFAISSAARVSKAFAAINGTSSAAFARECSAIFDTAFGLKAFATSNDASVAASARECSVNFTTSDGVGK